MWASDLGLSREERPLTMGRRLAVMAAQCHDCIPSRHKKKGRHFVPEVAPQPRLRERRSSQALTAFFRRVLTTRAPRPRTIKSPSEVTEESSGTGAGLPEPSTNDISLTAKS